ncbi:hypothetical protein [Pseudomonas sp. R5(2019)]|uniref:hypothetical protein n=1 Tax=Pseudomonas sp. R5(2019) TaxID=2697566 RepID=UPI001411D88F|nr:hypothetical protein [Pseudomonas sp. R5(2019)]NBA95713.1 hypothetical protein [Pseudomonas sp. R5(2019)]
MLTSMPAFVMSSAGFLSVAVGATAPKQPTQPPPLYHRPLIETVHFAMAQKGCHADCKEKPAWKYFNYLN